MTEQEWLTRTEPLPMLRFLEGKTNERKFRLFASACCRKIWHVFTDVRSQSAIGVGERYADDEATEGESSLAHNAALAVCSDNDVEPNAHAYIATLPTSHHAFAGANLAFKLTPLEDEDICHTRLLHDIFGNPFRHVAFSDSWRTSDVSAIAQTIYEDRHLPSGLFDNQRMGILADALEDAGCDKREVLDHCRNGGGHARGCWVVDLVLGKE